MLVFARHSNYILLREPLVAGEGGILQELLLPPTATHSHALAGAPPAAQGRPFPRPRQTLHVHTRSVGGLSPVFSRILRVGGEGPLRQVSVAVVIVPGGVVRLLVVPPPVGVALVSVLAPLLAQVVDVGAARVGVCDGLLVAEELTL